MSADIIQVAPASNRRAMAVRDVGSFEGIASAGNGWVCVAKFLNPGPGSAWFNNTIEGTSRAGYTTVLTSLLIKYFGDAANAYREIWVEINPAFNLPANTLNSSNMVLNGQASLTLVNADTDANHVDGGTLYGGDYTFTMINDKVAAIGRDFYLPCPIVIPSAVANPPAPVYMLGWSMELPANCAMESTIQWVEVPTASLT